MDRTIPFTPMLKENRTNIGKSCNYFAIAMPTMFITIYSMEFSTFNNYYFFRLLLLLQNKAKYRERMWREEKFVSIWYLCLSVKVKFDFDFSHGPHSHIEIYIYLYRIQT